MFDEIDFINTDSVIIDRKKVKNTELSDNNIIVSFRLLLKILNSNFTYKINKIDNQRTIIEYNNLKLFSNSNDVVFIKDPVVFLDYTPSYSHFLMDVLGKFFYINKYFPDTKPFFIISDKKRTEIYNSTTHSFKEIIEIFKKEYGLAGILDINNSNSFVFEKAYSIAPSDYLRSQLFYENDISVLNLRKLFLPDRPSLNNRNIFIPRKNIFSKRSENINSLIKLFIENNYEILYFEDLSFQEQINAFYDAKNIVALDGSSLVNVLFANKKANILAFHCDPEFHAYEWAVISKKLGINYSNIYINSNNVNKIFDIFNTLIVNESTQ